MPEVLADPRVRGFLQILVDRLWFEGTGSATRVARAHLLVEPASLEAGELTDKGSINQRVVLRQRDAIVRMLADGQDPSALVPRKE